MSKSEPSKAKANKSKPLIVYGVFVKINLFKNISCCKKNEILPFLRLFTSWRPRTGCNNNNNKNNNNNNLLIDRIVCQDAQRGHRNLSMAWIDVSNAYDSVDHRWLVEMFKLHRFPEWFGFLIGKLSRSWNTRIVIGVGTQGSSRRLLLYSPPPVRFM